MAEYSRDCLSAPMRELSRVYTAIQSGNFKPDVTRSGHLNEMTVLDPEQSCENDGSESDSARSANQCEDEEQEWLREG
eukprot:1573997-Amphidinium_carterae.1